MIHFKLKTKAFFTVMIAGILLAGFTGCSKKIMFERSSVVPGAEGSVKVKKDNNNNYSIELEVVNLAEAKRLTPPRTTYIVWAQTEQNSTKNLGSLNTSSGLLSKTLKASLNTVTPFKPTKIFITAEDDTNISYPSGETVLTTGSL